MEGVVVVALRLFVVAVSSNSCDVDDGRELDDDFADFLGEFDEEVPTCEASETKPH